MLIVVISIELEAGMITATIEDILLRLNLRIDNCRGQCYDGASNMSGAKSGVASRLTTLEAARFKAWP